MPHTPPAFDELSKTWLGTPEVSGITKYSLAFVLCFAFGMALMPGGHLHSKGIDNVKVRGATGYDTLYINGNWDDQFVKFPHGAHISRIGKDSCFVCHHLNFPLEKLSSCWECHSSMYTRADFFNHSWHSSADGAGLKCDDCHKRGVTRNATSAKLCSDCHTTYKFTDNKKLIGDNYHILSYVDALHNLCVSCHLREAKKSKEKENLALCSTCHKAQLSETQYANINWKIKLPHFNNVILPDVKPENLETK